MNELLEEQAPAVYRFAMRLTSGDQPMAEDVTQETMLRAWRARGKLRDHARLRVWLFTITANAWRDQLRRTRRPAGAAELLLDDPPARETAPPRAAVDDEDLRRTLEAMDRLPPRQREVLHLRACEEFSLDEIAAVLAITPQAAKASLSLARKRLREQLADICQDRFPLAEERGS